MTERLYYTDPYLTDFDARVVDVRRVDARYGVVLDRTAFYPTSGGQPFDTGTLGGRRVVDVIDEDDDAIVHLLDGELPADRVAGCIDWERRFEHMQQHTGQHVLSAAFERVCGARTVSFHLGSTVSTIDLAREVTPAEMTRAEDAANHVVWANTPVIIRFVDARDAATLPLRKEPVRSGTLRIVEVEGFDVSACGGTHVRRTGEIGIVVISAWERFRGGSRVEFRCGVRALRAHRVLRDAVSGGIQLISVAPEELPLGIERLQSDNRELKRRAKQLETRLAAYEARALAARAGAFGDLRVVAESIPDMDVNGLKALAQHIAALPGHAAVLSTASAPLALVIARSPDVPLDAGALLKELIAKFGGRGGGRPELAQGGGMTSAPEQVLDAVRAMLTSSRA